MSTWTATDVSNIKTLFNLEYRYVDRIESALTDFESQYGATAIADIQTKINEAIALKATIAGIEQSSDFGVTSQSVPSFYSFSRKEGTEVSGYRNAYDSLKQTISNELRLQDVARINTTRIIRA
tara:strand:+ start:728 stop:1099 length:372 start_codon:yes stop_codon:yes gene_type:complete